MSMILVTGGTGFVGRYVVRRLLDGDAEVRLLARDPARIDPATAEQVDVIRGDLCDRWAVARAIDRVDTVLHLAALARPLARRANAFANVNVEAVRNLLDAATAAGVRRFVHVSTWLVAPPDRPAPVRGRAQTPTPYETSKQAAEKAVAAYAASGREAVIVRPTRVYGPGPLHEANGATQMLRLYLSGRLRVMLDDRGAVANYVHADDVAAGILLAARRGSPGAVYTLGGPENVTLAQYLGLAAEIAGVRRRVARLSPRAALALARLTCLTGGLGGLPAIPPAWVRSFLESRSADIALARRDLGYAPRSLVAGMTETIAWLLDGGRLP